MDLTHVQTVISAAEASFGVPAGTLLTIAAGAGIAVAAVVLLAPKDGSGVSTDIIIAARERRDSGMMRDSAVIAKLKEQLKASLSWPASDLLLRKSAAELGRMIKSRTLTSEACVAFFCDRIIQVNPAINAVTETRFADALAEARNVDRAVRGGAADLPPLAGVPVSIKDQIHQAGMFTTMGSSYFASLGPSKADGLVARLVRSTGAIPIARTTTPQLLMAPETQSAVWGVTCNPYDPTRGCGGSSGGEGALVGALGTPLGIGTDIGGSLRIPAAHCGLATIKVTPQRVTMAGVGTPRGPPFADPATGSGFSGNDHVRPVWGPLARHPDDIEAVCEAMFSRMAHEGDPTAPIMPWRAREASTEGGTRRLRIGVLADGDGFFRSAEAAKRTVDDVAAALRAKGHRVVAFDGKAARLDECALGYLELMSADGGMQAMRSGLFGEPLHRLYATLAMAASLPVWLRYWVIVPLLRLMGTPRMADIVWASRPKTVAELWVAAGMREERRKAFVSAMQVQGEKAAGGPLDVLVCPAYPVPAPPHGTTREMSLASSHCYSFNYLHVPTGTITVSRVLDTESGRGASRGEDGKDRLGTATAATLEGCAGMPVSVQIVGRPFEDETVLCAMRCVRDAVQASTGELGKRLRPPSMPLAEIDVAGCL